MMNKIKYIITCFIFLFSGCASYEYQVRLGAESGKGYMHLITTNTKQEAEEFVKNQKSTHGDKLSITRIKK